MNNHNKKILTGTLSIAILLTACQEKPQQKVVHQPEQLAVSEPKSSTEVVEIPTTVQPHVLVNNPTPIPKGYQVDSTYLKQPKLIEFNGDGKLDAFSILKNPNKKGMQYLFEFRIADSDKVYWYENEDEGYDLDGFETFERAETGEKFVDMAKVEGGDMVSYEDAPAKARFTLQNDAITVGLLESCGTSLFYINDDKIHRMHLD